MNPLGFELLFKDSGYNKNANFSTLDMLLFYDELQTLMPDIFEH
jgi:hypothetical protein